MPKADLTSSWRRIDNSSNLNMANNSTYTLEARNGVVLLAEGSSTPSDDDDAITLTPRRTQRPSEKVRFQKTSAGGNLYGRRIGSSGTVIAVRAT